MNMISSSMYEYLIAIGHLRVMECAPIGVGQKAELVVSELG